MHPSPRQPRIAIDLSLILAVSLLVYAPSLYGYFLSDDFNIVTILSSDRNSVDWRNVLSDFYTVYRGDLSHSYYRPVVTLSGGIDISLWGINPVGPHLTNMLLNAFNGLLVYGIATLPPIASPGIGLTAGLLFALHPLHPEAVYWLVGRTELIMAFFTLLAILLYLAYSGHRRPLIYLGSLLSFILALASKETAVIVPIALTFHRAIARQMNYPAANCRASSSVLARHSVLDTPAPYSDTGESSRTLWIPACAGMTNLRQAAGNEPSVGSNRDQSAPPPIISLLPYYIVLGAYFVLRKVITGHLIGQYGATETNPSDPSLMPLGLAHLFLYQLLPGGSLLTSAGDPVIGIIARRAIGVFQWLSAAVVVVVAIRGSMRRQALYCLGLMIILALPVLSLLAARGAPDDFARFHYLSSAGFCLLLGVLLDRNRTGIRRVWKPAIVMSSVILLSVNSLPWIQAGRINRTILALIEQAANRPNVRAVLMIGNPEFHFGAQLFGQGSWALPVAAAAPFVRIPQDVRILHHPGDPCPPLHSGVLRGSDETSIFEWRHGEQRVVPLTWDQLKAVCRSTASPTTSMPSAEGSPDRLPWQNNVRASGVPTRSD